MTHGPEVIRRYRAQPEMSVALVVPSVALPCGSLEEWLWWQARQRRKIGARAGDAVLIWLISSSAK